MAKERRPRPKRPGVYQIRNTITGHAYVGSSARCVYYRRNGHLLALRRDKHENQKLQNAWNKYGESAFEFSILELVDDIDTVLAVEQRYIDSICPDMRYNLCPIAGRFLGLKWTREQLARVSAARKGRGHTPETRAKMSRTRTGRKHTPEWCANIGRGHKGKKLSEELKARIGAATRGRKASAETRAKMSAAQTGLKKHTAESKAKISRAHKGRIVSPETTAKIKATKERRRLQDVAEIQELRRIVADMEAQTA